MYGAINAITTELVRGGIPKLHYNQDSDYFYRSIDDVLNRLAPLLAVHRLCVLPRVLERSVVERIGLLDAFLSHVTLKVAFDLISVDDASCHTVEAFGEALDEGDKATAKAMSAAYKSAMLQAFCIPVAGEDDSDRQKHLVKASHAAEPVTGWEQWSQDLIEMIKGCQSEEALTRVQDSHRAMLKAIQRERAEIYGAIGEAFAIRRRSMSCQYEHTPAPTPLAKPTKSPTRPRKKVAPPELEHV